MRAVLKWEVKQSKGSRRSLDDEDGGGIEVALVYYRIQVWERWGKRGTFRSAVCQLPTQSQKPPSLLYCVEIFNFPMLNYYLLHLFLILCVLMKVSGFDIL